MQPGPRSLRSVAALVALGLTVRGAAQTPLPANSPFLPAGNAAATAAAPAGGLEFIAVLGEGSKTSIDLYDPQTKKSRWIPVRDEANGIAVLSYDATRNQVVIRTGGMEKRLTLRKESGVVAGAVSVSATPAPTTSSTAAAPALTPGTKPAPSATSPAITKEQTEARMLVSDLLEIGAAQRKAYEDAQKKVAEPTAAAAKPAAR
jgi:hypothetical protein